MCNKTTTSFNIYLVKGGVNIGLENIDLNKKPRERIEDYIKQVKNPYKIKLEEDELKLSFSGKIPINELLYNYYFSGKKPYREKL